MRDETIIVLSAIWALVLLALGHWYFTGKDGTALTTVSSIIGGFVGYIVRGTWERRKKQSRQ